MDVVSFDSERVMTQLIHTREPIHLHFDSGRVLIMPEDHPRFIRTAKRAVKVFQRENANGKKLHQFNDEYLPKLYQWCLERNGKVRACYLGLPNPHGLPVFVIGATAKYDFDLGDEISQFALLLEQEGWPSNILQLPDGEEEELRTFFKPETSLEIYAQAKTAPGESGA